MLLQIQNQDKIIGREFRWYQWKILVTKCIVTGDQYIFGCRLSNLKSLYVADYTIRLCRRSMTIFSHKSGTPTADVTPMIVLERNVIRDIDLFIMQMAGRINLFL